MTQMHVGVAGACLALVVYAIALLFPVYSDSSAMYSVAIIAIVFLCLFPGADARVQTLFLFVKKIKQEGLVHVQIPVPISVPETEHKDKYLAMDCEMVGVGPNGKRSALARVSIVDWDLKVVLDTYVQVMDRVTDYRTPVSGIKPKHLKGSNAMNFRKCREYVAKLLKDKIVVGHGLENDFDALRLCHPQDLIRDTSLYVPLQRRDGGKWRSKKLRELVQNYLRIDNFQKGEHDSVHDARAVMQLYHIFHRKWELNI